MTRGGAGRARTRTGPLLWRVLAIVVLVVPLLATLPGATFAAVSTLLQD